MLVNVQQIIMSCVTDLIVGKITNVVHFSSYLGKYINPTIDELISVYTVISQEIADVEPLLIYYWDPFCDAGTALNQERVNVVAVLLTTWELRRTRSHVWC